MSEDSKWDGFYFDMEKFIEMMIEGGRDEGDVEKICVDLMESQGIPFKVFPKEAEIISEEMPGVKIKISTNGLDDRPLMPCHFQAEIGNLPPELVGAVKIPELAWDNNMEPFSIDVKVRVMSKWSHKGVTDLIDIIKRLKNKKDDPVSEDLDNVPDFDTLLDEKP